MHYRAPPDVRGSGKERGHGTELAFCPKCQKDLKPGKHHVGCSAGKSTTRPSKKAKQVRHHNFQGRGNFLYRLCRHEGPNSASCLRLQLLFPACEGPDWPQPYLMRLHGAQ